MDEIVSILQNALLDQIDIDAALGEVQSIITKHDGKSKNTVIWRTLKSLRDQKYTDFLGHLRQTMLFFHCKFQLTSQLFGIIEEKGDVFGFLIEDQDRRIVGINPVILPKDDKLKSFFNMEFRRRSRSTIGDGRLFRALNYTTYTSVSQKILNYAITNMLPNETILACLPTGGGKSLSWQLPALSGVFDGLIIVVVPTIALAIDHEKSSDYLFRDYIGSMSKPKAFYSGTDAKSRGTIYEEIKDSRLPLLFISPEALLNKNFKSKIYDAAKEGKISSIFIDEAHLVVNWGSKFRPEFQLLSSFRRKVSELSPNGVRTVLLSATFTEDDIDIIKGVFDSEIFTIIRADELRTEPSYYFKKYNDEENRKADILRIACQAPKPMIIYTINPSQALEYFEYLTKHGFENIAIFSGETKNESRKAIISDWNDNRLDIIVATSAFGMGVDKSDVRTIISAYIPESISRFYQEVGRAGRDGFASISYFLTYAEIDLKRVNNLTKSAVLTAENIALRWFEMLSQSHRISENELVIDMKTPPEHLRYEIVGERNASWNKDVILMLFRAGLIEITDVEIVSKSSFKISIVLNNIRVLENRDTFLELISKVRDDERERIVNNGKKVNRLLKSERTECIATVLSYEFPYISQSCSGCPYCLSRKIPKYYNPSSLVITSSKKQFRKARVIEFADSFDVYLGFQRSIALRSCSKESIEQIELIIKFLIQHDINVIIIPPTFYAKELVRKLSFIDDYNYVILNYDEVMQFEIKWLNGTMAILYTDDEVKNNAIFELSKKYLVSNDLNRIIHLYKNDIIIGSENKVISDLVDVVLSWDQFNEGD